MNSYYNALDLAARGGKMEILELLLSSGADVRIANGSVFGELTLRFEMTRLKSPGCSVDNWMLMRSPHSPTDSAIWGGERVISRFLAEPMTPAEREGFLGRVLQNAARQSKHALCTWLLDQQGADVNRRGPPYGSPLQAALSDEYLYSADDINNRINLVDMFLRRGAEVNTDPVGPPPEKPPSAERGDEEEEEEDLFREAARCTALLLAVRTSPKLAQLLLDAGADVKLAGSPSSDLHSPLQYVARYSPTLLRPLLDRGADVHAAGGKYGTALHAAAYAHNPEALRLLIDHGADVNACAGRYGFAVQAAAKWNTTSSGSWTAGRQSVAALGVLVAAGADVNAAGGKYGSALQMAAKSGNMEALTWLLACGADIEAGGGKYGGVREAALTKKRWNVVSYLWRLYGK